jgi:hypothetical protein
MNSNRTLEIYFLIATFLCCMCKANFCSVTSHERPEGEKRYSSTRSLTSVIDGWVVNTKPRLLCPRERDPIRTVQEDMWAPGTVQSGRLGKIWLPPGFNLRTFHPVGSSYSDHAVPSPNFCVIFSSMPLSRGAQISGGSSLWRLKFYSLN